MSELRRRLLMQQAGGGGGVLPSEYQQVEYIEKNGANYIDIPIILEEPVEISLRVYCPYMGWNTTDIFGIVSYNKTFIFSKYYSVIGSNFFGNVSIRPENAYYPTPRESDVGDFWLIMYANLIKNESYVYREDTEERYDGTATNGEFPKATPLRVFDDKNKARTMRISYINITEKLHLIPCYRKSDNVAGLYDIVGQQFFTNNGSGSFTVGPDVN